jgi:D-serine deaminase-like pyridoxal phosphate-dependent protein
VPPATTRACPAARYALAEHELAQLLSPALVIHLDLVRANVRRVIELAGSPGRWRPHVKSAKAPVVFAELLAAGLRHFKCATLREARTLLETARTGGVAAPDLLLAHPLVGPALGELGRLAAEHPSARLSVLCEDARLAAAVPRNVSIFVDLDPGMGRTGVPQDDGAAIRSLARAAGTRFRGLHSYEGHLHGDPTERRARCFEVYWTLLARVEELERDGHAVEELVTSGTPAFQHALAFEPFRALGARHRVSPGTVVFHDLRSAEENPDLALVPAAVVLARVVSRPRADVVTCDAGSKSLAAEAGDPCAAVVGRPELLALAPSEEHLPLRVLSGPPPERGEALMLVPRHVCPTVNLAEEAVLVEDGAVRSSVPVSARAHDVWVRG